MTFALCTRAKNLKLLNSSSLFSEEEVLRSALVHVSIILYQPELNNALLSNLSAKEVTSIEIHHHIKYVYHEDNVDRSTKLIGDKLLRLRSCKSHNC